MIEPAVVLERSVQRHGHLLDDTLIPDQVTETCRLDAIEVAHAGAPGGKDHDAHLHAQLSLILRTKKMEAAAYIPV